MLAAKNAKRLTSKCGSSQVPGLLLSRSHCWLSGDLWVSLAVLFSVGGTRINLSFVNFLWLRCWYGCCLSVTDKLFFVSGVGLILWLCEVSVRCGGCYVVSLQLVLECVQCRNGHRFCLECLGIWALRHQHNAGAVYLDHDAPDPGWWNAADPYNFTVVSTPDWVRRLRCYFLFLPFTINVVDSESPLNARRNKLLNACARQNNKCLYYTTT